MVNSLIDLQIGKSIYRTLEILFDKKPNILSTHLSYLRIIMSVTESIVQYGFSISLIVNAALFIPQIISLIRTKSANGISLITFAGFNVIQLFTLLHGVYVNDYLLAGGYLLSIITCGTVSLLIIYYRYIKKELLPATTSNIHE